MNVQEAVKQTLDIYKNEDEHQSIENAMDCLLQLLKIDDEARIKKAVYREMRIKVVKSVKYDFSGMDGPGQVTHAFLSIDGMLFELGRFYESQYTNEDTLNRLRKVQEFEELCAKLFSA